MAGGKLVLDHPAEAVARLTISNPEKRNALDHDILDALAEVLPSLDRGIEVRCVLITGAGEMFSAGYDIGASDDEAFADKAEALVAHPFHAAMEAVSAHPYPVRGRDQRPLPRRGPGAGGALRPADLRRRRQARDAAREARADLRPHRARALHRRDRRRPRPRSCSWWAATSRHLTPSRSGSSTRWWRQTRLADAAVELAAEIAANAPLSVRGNKHAIETLARNPAPQRGAGGRAGRAAALLLCLRGLPRGDHAPSPRSASLAGKDADGEGSPPTPGRSRRPTR